MKILLVFTAMVTILVPFGQCHTFHRVTSDSGSVGWELKLEDIPFGVNQQEVVQIGTHKIFTPGLSQPVPNTYTPVTFYKTSTPNYYKKPTHVFVTEAPIIQQFVHKTRYQPQPQPKFKPIYSSTTFSHPIPTTVRAPLHKTANVVPSVHKKQYATIPRFHGQSFGRV